MGEFDDYVGGIPRLRVSTAEVGGALGLVSLNAPAAPTSNPASGSALEPPRARCDEPGCALTSALGGVGKCADHDPDGPRVAYEREARVRRANGWGV